MRTVQADNCFNSEQIDTFFISVGGQEGFGGGGGGWAGGPKNAHDCHEFLFMTPPVALNHFADIILLLYYHCL